MKMMSSGCLEAQAPTKAGFVRLSKRAESDAEFLKLMAEKENSGSSTRRIWRESYTSRQRYLRSYTFSKKKTVAERTKKKKRKERRKRTRSVGDASCVGSGTIVDCLLFCVVRIDVVER
ncbi:Sulfate transporter 1.2 [Cocos nucifera]|uniref:Sulfate transporter 1.2 n=1 Tax=Cocos nucifera TaxID=13894 RepID=A0A8K0I7G1_COCNU|nr:Sulfate transporter 1.2 [Cocos nucifera]